MALAQFKRILPPPPPKEIQQEISEMILAEAMRVLSFGTEEEWNDSFEPNDFRLLEPRAPESESGVRIDVR